MSHLIIQFALCKKFILTERIVILNEINSLINIQIDDALEEQILKHIQDKMRNKDKNTWTKEESHQFLSVAQEYQSYIAFWLALQFVLRFSEVLGLQWKNIDFKSNILHVIQAYHEDTKKLGRLKRESSQ